MTFHNDEPTTEDLIDRKPLVDELAKEIAACTPPHVFGVHGDWGSGKTSFLHQLHCALSGDCPQNAAFCRTKKKADTPKFADHVTVIWFEAWRYQHESAPIVALLQEIRTQLPWYAKALSEAKKLTDVTVRSAFLAFDQIANLISLQAVVPDPREIQKLGERWEKDNLATKLPSHVVREQLKHALDGLLGAKPNTNEKQPFLVVLVDDLDRCESKAAYKLLEGIKIYLNLPNCVFILGMNQSIIEGAIAEHLPKSADDVLAARRARDYLEKLCQTIVQLPLLRTPEILVERWISQDTQPRNEILEVLKLARQVPANPRRIKAFANTMQRFAAQAERALPISKKPADHQRRAKLLVVIAFLYQFQNDIYRLLEAYGQTFWKELCDWAQCKPCRHLALKTLEGTHAVERQVTPGSSADVAEKTPEAFSPPTNPTFPDPTLGHVVWIQSLIKEIEVTPVTDEELDSYMLR